MQTWEGKLGKKWIKNKIWFKDKREKFGNKDGEIEIRVGTQLKGGESEHLSAFSNILKTIVIHIL